MRSVVRGSLRGAVPPPPPGMFSYTMLASSGLFCHPSWPRRLCARFPPWLRGVLPSTQPPRTSPDCHYGGRGGRGGLRPRQHLAAAFTVLYVLEQLFLPYSHFITQVGALRGGQRGDRGAWPGARGHFWGHGGHF